MTRYLNFCSAYAVTVVIFGHCNRSCYLLAYLFTYLLSSVSYVQQLEFDNMQ